MDPRKPEQHLEGRSETGAGFAGSQKVHVGSGAAAAPSTAVPPLAHLAMEGSSSKSWLGLRVTPQCSAPALLQVAFITELGGLEA